jgi:hypothetical protein
MLREQVLDELRGGAKRGRGVEAKPCTAGLHDHKLHLV